MKVSLLRRLYLYSWLVTLPITATFFYWAASTITPFYTFGVRYNSHPFQVTLREAGRVEAYSLWMKARLAFDPRVPSLRRSGTQLRRVDLFVSEAAVNELDANLPHSGFRYVPASILDGDKLRKVKFRYRGDFANHWWSGKKSIRVKTKKSRLVEGVRAFNLIVPKFASQVNNHMGYQLASRMGLLAPQSEMVDVTVNGDWMGVYLSVEQPRELTLRRHGLMPGDLYAGELVAKDAYRGVSSNVFEHPGLWEKVAVNNHFPEESLDPLRALLALMRDDVAPEDAQRGLSLLLDMEVWGRFAAYETLAQTLHYDQAHNWRLYFDPARSRFLPLVWDPAAWHPNWMPRRGKPLRLDAVPSDLHALLFKNGDFLRARNAAIEAFFRAGESEAFLSDLEVLMARIEPSIQVDPYPYTLPGRNLSGPEAKRAAMHTYADSVADVFRGVRQAFLEEPGAVQHVVHPGGRRFGIALSGRRGIRSIVLRYAEPLPPDLRSAHIRYWRGEKRVDVDVSGALSRSGNRFEIATTLLPRYTITDTGKRTVMRYQAEAVPAYYELVLNEGAPLPVPLEVLVDRGREELETSSHAAQLSRVPFVEEYAVVAAEPVEELEVWEGVVEVNDVRELHHPLLIRPGTTVHFGPGAALILDGRLIAEGRADAPIRFVAASAEQDPWGALVLRTPGANGSRLAHCQLAGGSGLKAPLFEYSGMFSVHDVERVEVRSCEFRDSQRVDDMVHGVYAEMSFTDTAFLRAAFDAVDLDNSEGFFERCRFEQSGNDALDLMTSRAVVLDSVFEGSGDKGISVGEDSRVLAINDRFGGNQIGLQSKDGSVAVMVNVEIRDSRQALHAYQKNWQYGEGGKIFVYKADVRGSSEEIAAEKGSQIEVYDSYLGADIEIGKRVMLDARVDRKPMLAARDKRFARAAAEQAAFGDPFPSHWTRVRPERRGAAIP